MIYRLTNGAMTAAVSDMGAELQSLRLNGVEYLWQADEKYWGEHAPTLFPFVGRLVEETYKLNGEMYHMSIHGFAKACLFEAVEQTENTLTMRLSDTEKTREMYPYQFALTIRYTLSESGISVDYEVENKDSKTMYFGLGGHPGFNVPMDGEGTFEDYYLEFAQESRPDRVQQDEACFLTGVSTPQELEDGRILRLHHDMFDEDAIMLENMATEVTLKSDKTSHSVTVKYPHMTYLGLWHLPKSDAPYIAIEPWTSLQARTGVIEEFSCKKDLIRLEAGEAYKNGICIEVE